MSTATLLEMANLGTQFYRLTVAQYHDMIKNGILPEGAPYELIDGYIVQKDRSASGENPMTVGIEHIWVVKRLSKLDRELESKGCHLQTQQPISLPPHNEPEPDAAIIVGVEDDYRKRKPVAKQVLCAIEVADASVKYDQTEKLRIYAKAGIACYIIVNLADRAIEMYTEPNKIKARYGQVDILRSGQNVAFPSARGGPLVVAVRRLLP